MGPKAQMPRLVFMVSPSSGLGAASARAYSSAIRVRLRWPQASERALEHVAPVREPEPTVAAAPNRRGPSNTATARIEWPLDASVSANITPQGHVSREFSAPARPDVRDVSPASRGDVGCRSARGRVTPDGFACHQRQPARATGDPRAGPEGDARAWVPAELPRAGAGHLALSDAWRGELRHYPVRAGVDATGDRARRARGGLFHHRRQPEVVGSRVDRGR